MQNKNFWIELWLLLIFVFVGIGITAIIISILSVGSVVAQMHIAQWLQTALVMFIPALAWYRIRFAASPFQAYGLTDCSWKQLLLTLVLMVCSVPVMDFFTVLNYTMPLPESLREIGLQLRTSNATTVETLLSLQGTGGMVELVLLMTIGTALAEETMFRGALVKCFGLTKLNRHWIAILVGFVFSFIHFDPLGFIPRWLLGSLFCYLLFWSGSLWTPILAHTVNNMVALVQYKMSASDATVESLLNQSEYLFAKPVIIASGVVSAVLIVWIRKINVK